MSDGDIFVQKHGERVILGAENQRMTLTVEGAMQLCDQLNRLKWRVYPEIAPISLETVDASPIRR